MRSSHRSLVPFAVAAASASVALATPASALTFVSASGVFSGPSGTTVEPPLVLPPAADPLEPLPGGGIQTGPTGIRWGTAQTSAGRSGLRLYGSSYAGAPGGGLSIPLDATGLQVNKLFELDHINQPITGAVSSVNLTFTFNFIDQNNNPTTVITSAIPITIEETDNTNTLAGCTSGFQQSNIPCDDRITLTQPSIQFFPVNTPKGNEFLVVDLQFPTTGTNFIITQEGGQNPFDINANFRLAPSPLPFGAVGALSLLASGIRPLRKRYSAINTESE